MSEASSSFHQRGGVLLAASPSSCFCMRTEKKRTQIHTEKNKHTWKQELKIRSLCCRGWWKRAALFGFPPLGVLAGCLSPFLRFRTSSQNTPSTSRNKLFAHAWVRWNSLAPEFSLFNLSWPIRCLERHKGGWQMENKVWKIRSDNFHF